MTDMSSDISATQSYGQVALRKLAPIPENNLSHQLSLMLQSYVAAYPSEVVGLRQLSEQLEAEPLDVFRRSNMSGHVTASALVLDKTRSNVLLINHPLYNGWLQPGGHVEAGCQSLWGAALDEVTQETGLPAMDPFGSLSRLGIPLDIETHSIPANPMKGEGDHFHHDVMFIAITHSDFAPRPQSGDAVKVAKWFPLSALSVLPGARMKRVTNKVAAVLVVQRAVSQFLG